MARPLRIKFEGAWYHVMNRGINHSTIFFKDSHKIEFLKLLSVISRSGRIAFLRKAEIDHA